MSPRAPRDDEPERDDERLEAEPETTTEAERVEAVAALVKAENALAPAEDEDPLELAPWERHEGIDEPLTGAQIADLVRESQGLEVVHTASDGMVRTWADAEAAADAPEPESP